ncbi:MAG: radical SAM family heme chaperone HemW [Chthonomonadales bacterium]|nr:radical SAM family heme chaperone HemW [Chthonomonadales bacterium]
MTIPHAVYVHVPFCARKCAYCDFNAYAGAEALIPAYVDALVREVDASVARACAAPTVYFGGGTPTLLEVEQAGALLAAVRRGFAVDPDAEITIEANPTSADAARFARLRALGFNRISIGVQAFDDGLLAAMDREHTGAEAERAVTAARAEGFGNVSIDLMFGFPGQSLAMWAQTLGRALELGTEHVSLYSLTVEPGTRFERLHAGGKLTLPPEEDQVRMYETAVETLTRAGLERYEVSSFARPGYEARHNMTYWRNEPYLGFGAGAVSYSGGTRWTSEKHPARYIARVRSGAPLAVTSETLDHRASAGETAMLGLRMARGLDLIALRRRYGEPVTTELLRRLDGAVARGLVVLDATCARMTAAGFLLANEVAIDLLP